MFTQLEREGVFLETTARSVTLANASYLLYLKPVRNAIK